MSAETSYFCMFVMYQRDFDATWKQSFHIAGSNLLTALLTCLLTYMVAVSIVARVFTSTEEMS